MFYYESINRVSHVLFIPPLVSKSYAPCFFHVRTFPVLLVMSPVHAMRVFVHSIYAWQQIHVWMQTHFQWNETILDGSRILRWYVRSVRGFSPYSTECVVSVPDLYETSGFRHRSHYQDPNHLTTSVKWRYTVLTASEEFRFLCYFTDAWKYTSTRRLHLPKCVFTILVMVRGKTIAHEWGSVELCMWLIRFS